jgi:hypothetical protein
VFVVGIAVRDEAILELSRLVDDPDLATRLDENYSRGTKVLASPFPNARRSSRRLRTLPADLAELRGVLLRELAGLRSEGLA